MIYPWTVHGYVVTVSAWQGRIHYVRPDGEIQDHVYFYHTHREALQAEAARRALVQRLREQGVTVWE